MNKPEADPRKRWREQQRAQRLEQADEQQAALLVQANARQAWDERARQAPVVGHVTWHGQTYRVLNLADAQVLLGRIRDTDKAPYYHLLDDAAMALRPVSDGKQWGVLVADAPVTALALELPAQLPDHPSLQIAAWVFAAGLNADVVRVEDGVMLAVLGPARAGLIVLSAGQHVFTEGLNVSALLCRHYRCQVLVRGALLADCLIGAGNDVACTDPPLINLLATDDADRNRSRIMTRHGRSYRFYPPTHALEAIVAPRWLRRDARGSARLVEHLDELSDAQMLLRPRDAIDAVYDGFAVELEQAMEMLSAVLRHAGPAQLSARFGPSPSNHAQYSETAEGGRELVRQIDHSETVRVSATQPRAGGPAALQVMHLSAPVRDRHVRDARPDDDDPEACMIKLALRDAVARLLAHYGPA